MIDPLLITGGLKLLGGLFSSSQANKAAKRQEYLNSPAGIRAESEAAGFNPLVFAPGAGSFGSPYATMGAEMLGNVLSDVSGDFADGVNLRMENTQLQQRTEKLTRRLQNQTLNPEVGGIYGAAPAMAPRPVAASAPVATPTPLPESAERAYGPERHNINEAPLFTAFGRDWWGSGGLSTGGTFEDALGESEVWSSILYPFVAADAVGWTLGETRFRPDMVHDNSVGRTRALSDFVGAYGDFSSENTEDERAARGFGRSSYGSGVYGNPVLGF